MRLAIFVDSNDVSSAEDILREYLKKENCWDDPMRVMKIYETPELRKGRLLKVSFGESEHIGKQIYPTQ